MSQDDLDLRIRRVANGAGEVYTDLTVSCPRRGRSVPLAECESCEHCAGVRYDQDQRRSVVRCSWARPATLWTRRATKVVPAAADLVPVGRVMTGDVICVTPDYSLDALATLLAERGFSGAPVVDDEGRPIGVVSQTDLLREQLGPRETVADVMTPLAFTLPESAPLSQAAALMIEEGVHRLPIVSSEGRVVGVLTSFDVMRWLARESGYGA